MDYPDPNVSSNTTSPTITASPLTEGRNQGMFLPEGEVEALSPSVLGENSVTIGSTVSKILKEAYNNSFVTLEKPDILNKTPQRELLEHATNVKSIAQQILKDEEEEAQVTVASDMLATNEVFLKAAQQHYLLYLAAGAVHQEQTDEDNPTIASELQQNNFYQEGLQNAFTTVKNIAIKALIFT